MKQLLKKFSELAAHNKLSFSSQEVIKQSIIGLDGINRKLLILQTINNGAVDAALININDIETCSVKKQYGAIKSGGLRSKPFDDYLEKMYLHFEIKNQDSPIDIPVYDHASNEAFEIPGLERKARRWESVLSKMRLKPKTADSLTLN